MNIVIKSVEELSSSTNSIQGSKNIIRKCVSCDRTDLKCTELLKFRSIEEFLVYFCYLFEKKFSSINIDSNYSNYYERNKNYYYELVPNLQNIMKLNLRSVKYLCNNCLNGKLLEQDGMNHIYRAMEIHMILENHNLNNLLNSKKEGAAISAEAFSGNSNNNVNIE